MTSSQFHSNRSFIRRQTQTNGLNGLPAREKIFNGIKSGLRIESTRFGGENVRQLNVRQWRQLIVRQRRQLIVRQWRQLNVRQWRQLNVGQWRQLNVRQWRQLNVRQPTVRQRKLQSVD